MILTSAEDLFDHIMKADDDDSDQCIGSVCGEDDDIYWRRVVGNANPILKKF